MGSHGSNQSGKTGGRWGTEWGWFGNTVDDSGLVRMLFDNMGGCCRVMCDRFGKVGGGFVGDKPSPEVLITSIHNIRKIGVNRARCWGWGRKYRFRTGETNIGKVDIRRNFLRHCEKWQESLLVQERE